MNALTPVPFRKARGHAPRLSPARVPGRHSDRFWSVEEEQVLREHYPTGGFAACQLRLADLGSSKAVGRGIYIRARAMGLSAPTAGRPRQTHSDLRTPEMDARIREGWAELRGRGAVQRFADELGLPRSALSRRAEQLGLTMPHRKEPEWTAAEESLLPTLPLHDLHRASAMMRSLGYSRTPTSIMVKVKRLGISRRRSDVFSGTRAAALLGIDNKTVTAWCIDGSLPATRRGTARLPQQGGDTWSITPGDLRQFVLDNLDRIDLRKVDKHAFVDLLVTAVPPAAVPLAASVSEPCSTQQRVPMARRAESQEVAPRRQSREVRSRSAKRTIAEILADCGDDASDDRADA